MHWNGNRVRRAMLMALAAALFGSATILTGGRWSQAAQGDTPANLAPPEGQVLQRTLLGIGAQVYICRASSTAAGYEWSFTAPAAVLLDESGAIAGTHFAGPTWLADDGSSVTGAVVERAPSPEPSAIPWLLLKATPSDAPGDLAGVGYIQRLGTTGGVAPSEGCDAAHVGAVARVPYTAVYTFYGTP